MGVLGCLFEADDSKVIEDKVKAKRPSSLLLLLLLLPWPLLLLLRLRCCVFSLAGCLLLPHRPFLLLVLHCSPPLRRPKAELRLFV